MLNHKLLKRSYKLTEEGNFFIKCIKYKQLGMISGKNAVYLGEFIPTKYYRLTLNKESKTFKIHFAYDIYTQEEVIIDFKDEYNQYFDFRI